MSNYPKLIEDTGVIRNEWEEPMAAGDTFSRYLVWDTGREVDRFIRQCFTASPVAHHPSMGRGAGATGHMDCGQFQDFLKSPENLQELSFDVQCITELAVYDSEDDIDPQDYGYDWVSAHRIDSLKDSETWAETYIKLMQPEHVAPLI